MAQTQATKEALWLQLLLSPLLMDKQEPTTTIIFGDNKEVIALAKNPQFHARTKQIAIQNHFMKEQQTARTVKLQCIPTKNQVVDEPTKTLAMDLFTCFRNEIKLDKNSNSQQ